jgi:hypothetical protein
MSRRGRAIGVSWGERSRLLILFDDQPHRYRDSSCVSNTELFDGVGNSEPARARSCQATDSSNRLLASKPYYLLD